MKTHPAIGFFGRWIRLLKQGAAVLLFGLAFISIPAAAKDAAAGAAPAVTPDSIVDCAALRPQIQRVMDEAVRALAAKKVEADGKPDMNQQAVSSALADVDSCLDRDELQYAIQAANRYRTQTSFAPLREAWEAIVALLNKERERQNAALKSAVKQAMAGARDACRAAERPEQCEPILENLHALQELRQLLWPNRIAYEFQRVDYAINFVRQLQDLLEAVQAGDSQLAAQLYNGLQGYPGTGRLLSAAELKAKRKPAVLPINEWVSNALKTATATSLPDVATELAERLRNAAWEPNNDVNAANSLQYGLSMLTSSRLAMEDGRLALARQAWLNTFYYAGPWTREFAHQMRNLEAEYLGHATQRPPGDFLKSGAAPLEVLIADADRAAEKRDWAAVETLLSILVDLDPGEGRHFASELEACRSFLAGQRLESAGQTAAAVEAYQAVLKKTGRRIPYEQAGESARRLSK